LPVVLLLLEHVRRSVSAWAPGRTCVICLEVLS
jgi:hypothetical protein